MARRFETLHILQITQGIAAALCLASYWAPGVASYWVLSMAMFAFKSSYLLNFPYLMRTETDATRAGIDVRTGVIVGRLAADEALQRLSAWLTRAHRSARPPQPCRP